MGYHGYQRPYKPAYYAKKKHGNISVGNERHQQRTGTFTMKPTLASNSIVISIETAATGARYRILYSPEADEQYQNYHGAY